MEIRNSLTIFGTLLLALVLLSALVYAIPAAWVARYVSNASDDRVRLAHARGLWHRGSALLVLTSGAGGADAVHWPQRVQWTISPRVPWRWLIMVSWPQAGAPLSATLEISQSGWSLSTSPWRGAIPLAALAGLGAPFNTLALTGEVQVSLGDLRFSSAKAVKNTTNPAPSAAPDVDIMITQLRSALAQGVVLGDYTVRGNAASTGQFELATRQGALLLDGRGQCILKSRLSCSFNGTARAARHDDALLGNLLGLLGKIQPQPKASFSGTTPVTELRW